VTWRILTGDCFEVLRTLPADSVQCCVTSPPYWGLRDYGVEGQIGLERTPEEYVARMVEVFREVRRVLRPDGILWLNLGDSYCSTDKWGGGGNTGKHSVATDGTVPSWAVRTKKAAIPGLKPKDLVGIPWRVAFALQADGWWLRADVIWSKPNPMPESVRDRPTKAHEYVFLFAKSEGYFYDADAIREQHKTPHKHRATKHGHNAMRGQESIRPRGNMEAVGDPAARYYAHGGRNRRSVWTISTKPFNGAHFATMPWDLVEPCILAGSRPGDLVLDPFSGAGTVGVVAQRHGRGFIGIDLNPAYVEMAENRIVADAPLFNAATGRAR